MNAKQQYIWFLRVVSFTLVVAFASLTVMIDANETKEPWEFVPVQTK